MRQLRQIILFLFIACALAGRAHADIVEAATYADVENAVKDADAATLVVFDIDDVLTYSSDPAFQRGNWRENQHFIKCFLKRLTPDQLWLFANASLVHADVLPVDQHEWSVIRKLQERNVKVIALTGAMPGLIGDVYSQEWRFKQLKRLNIDFSNAFPETPSFCMNDLCCYMGRYPAFYNGILFANGELRLNIGNCNKGEVLVEFFRRVSWRPARVIFIDDSILNLQAAEKELALFNPGVKFLGLHFTYAPPSQSITPDELQAAWNRVLTIVKEQEKKHPCCMVY